MAICYYPPQWWPIREAVLVPPCFNEDKLPFMPTWSLVYQSVFLLHVFAFWANDNLRSVRRYGLSIALAFATGAVFFWCLPTFVPRPDHTSFLYRLLIASVDGSSNAFPSLHAAMSTLGMLRFWSAASILTRRIMTAWWIALLFSTLVTHQHRVADIFTGVLLAAVIWWSIPCNNRSKP